MIHRIAWRVGSKQALEFWQRRLGNAGVASEITADSLTFADPEGLGLELIVAEVADAPLIAEHPEIPAELALQGFAGVRAYSVDAERSREFLESGLDFAATGSSSYESRGDHRGSFYLYDSAPERRGMGGAGTVHHVAWSSTIEDHIGWRDRMEAAGARPTPVIDRYYFKSIYFREPSGVLFEIATLGPGFTSDEPLDHLGERISLPPNFEHLREQVERTLTPLPNPRVRLQSPTSARTKN